MAFHSYTRLVRKLFNAYRCGPPSRVTGSSPWASVDHSVWRVPPPSRRPLQARFHCGAAAETPYLAGDGNSQAHYAKGTPSHDKIHAPTACRRMVSGSISPSSSESFSPFPHGTGTLSVSREYLALPDGPGGFTQDSSCPALLRIPLRLAPLRVRSCHALRPAFPGRSARDASCDDVVLLPRARRNARGLGFSPVARHYWGNHCCFLFLRVLRCFSSPRWPHDFLMMAASGPPGCPIRRSADQRPFAPTRGFSQLTTSFIASVSLGIHHAPLLSFSLSRGGSAPAKGARDAALPSLCQHVKDLAPEKPACGE